LFFGWTIRNIHSYYNSYAIHICRVQFMCATTVMQSTTQNIIFLLFALHGRSYYTQVLEYCTMNTRPFVIIVLLIVQVLHSKCLFTVIHQNFLLTSSAVFLASHVSRLMCLSASVASAACYLSLSTVSLLLRVRVTRIFRLTPEYYVLE
jgi:hypothetical protein